MDIQLIDLSQGEPEEQWDSIVKPKASNNHLFMGNSFGNAEEVSESLIEKKSA